MKIDSLPPWAAFDKKLKDINIDTLAGCRAAYSATHKEKMPASISFEELRTFIDAMQSRVTKCIEAEDNGQISIRFSSAMDFVPLPDWADFGKDKKVHINSDDAWMEWCDRIDAAGGKTEADQYWWDVVRRCITKEIKYIHGTGLIIHFMKCELEDNDPKKMKPGRGYEAGSDEWRKWWNLVLSAEQPAHDF